MRDLQRVYRGFGVALLVVLRVLIGQDARATGPTVAFDLPAGDFSKMILEFGRQANTKVWYTSPNGSIQGVTTRPVAGVLSASDALARMLDGTGFTWEWETENSVVLHVRAAADLNPRSNSDGVVRNADRRAWRNEPQSPSPAEISEILVTGTFLRSVDETSAPMVRVRRRELNRTGFATAEASLNALPMNFLGGARGDAGNTVAGNFNHGEAPNLRGLGPGATLVLVNGHRQPASGADGNFVDISTVPVSAIDRIEVMPDGASALYGSDAIAGVVNVVLRQDLDGAETRTRLTTVQGGGGNEVLLSQLAAERWEGGHGLLVYQFSDRDALPAAERSFAGNSDKRPFGGDDLRSYRSNPANILDPRTFLPAFAIPQDQDGSGLSASDLLPDHVNLQNSFLGLDLLPMRRTHGLYVTATQTVSPQLETFAEARYNRRDERQTLTAIDSILTVPSSNAFYVDPFGHSPSVLVAYNFYDDIGPTQSKGYTETSFGTVGIHADLPRSWRATLSASYGREHLHWDDFNLVDPEALASALADSNPETAFNPFGSGSHTTGDTLNSIRMTERDRATSTTAYVDLVADGTFLSLPGGMSKLALGLGGRQERLFQDLSAGALESRNKYARENFFGFAELSLPLVHGLDLSLAGRYERYRDFGATFNEKVGLSWSPTAAIKIRSSWGSSFRAPLLVDLDERNTAAGFLSLPDPRSPSGRSLVLGVQGNNANLRQETASSWTAGIDFSGSALPGFTASLTYFAIDYRDRVARPGPSGALLSILSEEDRWGAPVIIRHPSRAQVDALCATPLFFGSRSDCLNEIPDAIVDIRLRNLATTSVTGLDAALGQSLLLPRGEVRWAVDGTYLLNFSEGVTRSSPAVSLLNTISNPLTLRLRGTLDWYQNGEHLPGFGASFTTHYANGYGDNRSVPNRHIDASTTFDLQMVYRTERGSRRLDDVEIACGAVDLFGKRPPFVNTERGYDIANAEPTGRLLTLFVQKNW